MTFVDFDAIIVPVLLCCMFSYPTTLAVSQSPYCRDARVYHLATTAMYDIETPPVPPSSARALQLLLVNLVTCVWFGD